MHRALLVLALSVGPALYAATPTTGLRGRVTSGGKPVPSATITATSKSLQQPRTTTTTTSGTYWLEGLPPGRYEVTFASPGLQTLTRRAVVELARVARADAVLEPSEDEESITSTIKTVGVSDTIGITTHRTAEVLARLPVYQDSSSVVYASTGVPFSGPVEIDGVPEGTRNTVNAEALNEGTVVRAAHPLEFAETAGQAIHVQTRSGGEELSLSVRDTLSSQDWVAFDPDVFPDGSIAHLLEGAAGGRIVSERLWFFGSGFTGKRRDISIGHLEGLLLKLIGQPAASHNVAITYDGGHVDLGSRREESSLRVSHTAQWGSRFSSELTASHRDSAVEFLGDTRGFGDGHSLYARGSYVAGDHVLRTGLQYWKRDDGDVRYAFLNDRWTRSRLTVSLAAGYETLGVFSAGPLPDVPFDRSHTSGQAAATYDLGGDGRMAAIAALTRYADPVSGDTMEMTAGFTSAIGSSGFWRIDAVRTDKPAYVKDSVEIDGTYRLFDRLIIGGNYSLSDFNYAAADDLGAVHIGNAWMNIDIPLFTTHAVSATLVQHYEKFGSLLSQYRTDAALRYILPIGSTALTLAGDLTNVFNDTGVNDVYSPRTMRLWIRFEL